MEVFVDSVKFVPETDKTIVIRGISYENVAHWLFNIRCSLIDDWVKHIKEGQPVNETPEQKTMFEKIKQFDEYTEKYLGYVYDKDNHNYVEIWQ